MTQPLKLSELAELWRLKMDALENIGVAIGNALDECAVEDVLTILTGSFVGLTIEVVRRKGHDTSKQITVSGGKERDITIHAPKKGVE